MYVGGGGALGLRLGRYTYLFPLRRHCGVTISEALGELRSHPLNTDTCLPPTPTRPREFPPFQNDDHGNQIYARGSALGPPPEPCHSQPYWEARSLHR